MKSAHYSTFLFLFAILFSFSWVSRSQSHEKFLHCLSLQPNNSSSISKVVFSPNNNSYSSILESPIQNLRFSTIATPKPLVIVTPLHASHIQATIYCSRKHGLQIRSRSGGHDFEGLSSVSGVPFVLIDFLNLRSVDVDVANNSAWVESGATIGELYYKIAEKSKTLAFPAGTCHTVGVGGHFSGGGHVTKTLEQNATELIHRWQYVAHRLPNNIFVLVTISRIDSGPEGNKTIQASFNALFLGRVDKLISLMEKTFPELGLVKQDCTEMSWIQSVLHFGQFPLENSEILLDRTAVSKSFFKVKADYVREPIPKIVFEGMWQRFYEEEGTYASINLIPFGGKMDEIPETETPFPHRAGNIYEIMYIVGQEEEENLEFQKYISWIRRFYRYMTPYVSKSPRQAYVNYRDLDIGVNNEGKTSYEQASVWAFKYFNNNFNKLVHVKSLVDPDNFFKHEQSIPPLLSW
ncbi:hypothetical protein REPUB_Repub07fG0130600 [Reevesia pubescens]